ncbi:pentapeptide repeat-containing protein [Candidatus Electronema sp. JC]|uniref:pentapeptide repeat-containing protein n=1 Tax=Candidatus Electronema sp. JC TaxID=3401570 RepID=UPI003B439569
MANKEQLAILKQGVAAWNKWREENPDAKIDLRGAKLDGLDLSGANFRKADIRGANFRNAMLVGANFNESILGIETGTVNVTDFTCSELTGVIFDNGFVEHVSYLFSGYRDIRFSYSILNYTS